ncbi:MAG TPA: hypothetical protein VJ901_14175 [Thermoanaerobaculia bacterium]|nr:hypothetical protein [Thermoanaerobaculia bacterium]
MKRAVLLFAFLTACASHDAGTTQSSSQPGHGAISITVAPNPIVATSLGGNMYEFPFEVVLRETGGRPVNVTRVSADVFALGSVRVAAESWDASKINSFGYATTLPAHGELRYAFRPRKEVTDERLFAGVTAEVRVDAVDDTGTATSAATSVGVRK